ncbi:outer membrane protein [Oricola thermophila]|uniref:Porin family protein n=1 Tax=Oricola thermophila TaxID=2742145 RepID=A0A6N1VD07_9HYPH|nr:outer membrane protein [Oricola thermophila]QKV18403.1 porin family protein [Oricola thermophila]
MRRLTKLAGGVALAALAANVAHAADAIEAPPEPPMAAPVEYAPQASWSGFYAGVFGGYNWGTFDATGADIDADGWSGGAFAGYNMQSGQMVYGVEADAGYSGTEGTLGGIEAKQTGFGSLRARVGYAFDPVMIYGTGGLAISGAEVDDGTVTDSNTHLGWTIGAGADALITDNVFGRLEYRYSDYQDKDYATSAGTVSSGFSAHTVNAGIGVKF